MLCGTFFHRCYSWTRFLGVFSVVLVETKSTDEFFSTISTLILNVHGSKSRSQLKSSTIFKTVSTIDFWQTLSLHLIQIPSSTFYSFSTFWSSVPSGPALLLGAVRHSVQLLHPTGVRVWGCWGEDALPFQKFDPPPSVTFNSTGRFFPLCPVFIIGRFLGRNPHPRFDAKGELVANFDLQNETSSLHGASCISDAVFLAKYMPVSKLDY